MVGWKFRRRANRHFAAAIWIALAPVWSAGAGDGEIMPPSVQACLELEIALDREDSCDLSTIVARACDAIEAERDPVLRRMMQSRLWEYRERLPVELISQVDVVLAGTVAVFTESEAGPPELLAVSRIHFLGVPDVSAAGIRGARVKVNAHVADARPDELVITTAFVSATYVIDASERWSGRAIAWGRAERLNVIIRAVADDKPAFFDQEERTVYLGTLDPTGASETVPLGEPTEEPFGLPVHDPLDVARVPDAVAHEAGHAVVNALKPGWGWGVTLVIHEAVADVTAVLVALENPWVLERVFRETKGDLGKDNEATRLCESIGVLIRGTGATAESGADSLRSVLDTPDLDAFGMDPNNADLPADTRMSWKPTDPHGPGQIISSALYETFYRAYEALKSRGVDPVRAILEARRQIGVVMLRALDYCGEHRVSLRDYARALLWTDYTHLQSKLHDALMSSLTERGLLDPADDATIASPPSGNAPSGIKLDSGVHGQEDFLRWVEDLEGKLLSEIRERNDFSGRFIRHRHRYALMEEASAAGMSVFSDSTSTDGYRVVRLHYQVLGSRLIYARRASEGRTDTAVYADESHFPPVDVFVSLVFDPSGTLIVMHTDRPWP
jgi:hypothetical protein